MGNGEWDARGGEGKEGNGLILFLYASFCLIDAYGTRYVRWCPVRVIRTSLIQARGLTELSACDTEETGQYHAILAARSRLEVSASRSIRYGG